MYIPFFVVAELPGVPLPLVQGVLIGLELEAEVGVVEEVDFRDFLGGVTGGGEGVGSSLMPNSDSSSYSIACLLDMTWDLGFVEVCGCEVLDSICWIR